MMAPAAPTRLHPAPGLDRAVQVGLLAVLATGSTGLVLAVVGVFRPVLAIPLAGVAFAALVRATRPTTAQLPPSGRPARAAGLVALGIIAVVTLGHAADHGEHLLTDRDPGVYVTTGRWLAAEGQLMVPTPDDPFAEVDTGIRRDLGFHHVEGPDSDRAPQFAHLLPVLLAWGYWLGGTTGLLVVPALLGGLALAAIWSFASRLLRPWTATAAVAALALGPLQLAFTRDAYSEPLTQALLFGGLVVLLVAVDASSPRHGAVAGLLLGATLQARIDGVGLVVLLPVWLALVLVLAGARRADLGRVVAAVAAGAAASVAVGLVDLWWRSPVYLDRLAGELVALGGALAVVSAASAAFVAVARRRPEVGDRLGGGLRRTASVLAVLVLAVGFAAWLVRPHVTETHGEESPAIAAIQESEGSTVDPTLRYSEDSLRWQAWYLGAPAVALGIVGIALALALRVRRPDADALALLGLATLGVTALYLWRPSISPDHPWVMRRYLVATAPALVLFGAWLLDHLSARLLGARSDALRRADPVAVACAVAVLLAVPAATASWPLRTARAQPGTAAAVDEVCRQVGPDAALAVIPEDNLSLVAPLALRAWCGVPVGVVGVDLGTAGWADLAAAWQAQGRVLYAVARTSDAIRLVVPDARPNLMSVSGLEAERTLTRPARSVVGRTLTLAVAPVEPEPGN